MSKTDPKQDVFPHDRVVFFSDAVFAIAITLLAIEVRLPEGQGEHGMQELVALLVAYVISFLVTAQFWANHMVSWRRVKHVTPGLLWLNIAQLLFVALMPFVTSIYAKVFVGDEQWPLTLYGVVLTGVSLFGFLCHRLIVRQMFAHGVLSANESKVHLWSAIAPLIVFALIIPLSLVIPPWMGSLFFMAIIPLDLMLTRWAKRRYLEELREDA